MYARELKFRLWDKKHNKMLFFSGPNTRSEYDVLEFHPVYDFSFLEDTFRERSEYTDAFEDHYSLMRFTGMKDKRGMDIYEGDILSNDVNMHTLKGTRRKRPIVMVMLWGDTIQDDSGNTVIGWSAPPKDWEIIGNVHEDGDLLK